MPKHPEDLAYLGLIHVSSPSLPQAPEQGVTTNKAWSVVLAVFPWTIAPLSNGVTEENTVLGLSNNTV